MAFLAAVTWFLSSQFLNAVSSHLNSNRNAMSLTKSNLAIKRHCMSRSSSGVTNSINTNMTLYNYAIATDMPCLFKNQITSTDMAFLRPGFGFFVTNSGANYHSINRNAMSPYCPFNPTFSIGLILQYTIITPIFIDLSILQNKKRIS